MEMVREMLELGALARPGISKGPLNDKIDLYRQSQYPT